MAANHTLAETLTLDRVKTLASGQSFSRGEDYYENNAVATITQHDETITATVCGSEKYTVRLAVGAYDETDTSAPEIDYRCSCPYSHDEGEFCKHCVAVALAWLESKTQSNPACPSAGSSSTGAPSADDRSTAAKTPEVVKLDDLRPWLLLQPKETLADALIETAAYDRRLREQLLRRVALATGKHPDIAAIRNAIRHATTIRGYIDWKEASAFANGLLEIAGTLKNLNEDGFHADAIELAEYALERINTHVADRIDDSDGEVGLAADELLAIHHEATRLTNTQPAQLARRIHAWVFADDYGYLSGLIERYADLLGPDGLATLRTLIEQPRAQNAGSAPTARDYKTDYALRAIARLTADIETLVALETRDLSHPHAYLRAAEIYRDDNQHDKALDWAQRGLKKFSGTHDHQTTGLVDFLIAEYARRGWHDKTVALAWEHFEQYARLEHYQRLKETVHAAKARWPEWRERALAHLRHTLDAAIAKQQKTPPSRRSHPTIFFTLPQSSFPRADYSELVRVLLWEGDTDAAWTAASDKGCNEHLWLELADKRAAGHPAESIPIYKRHIASLVEQTNSNAYEAAIRLLRKTQALHARLNQTAEWETTLETLRQTYRKKRNFIKLLATL